MKKICLIETEGHHEVIKGIVLSLNRNFYFYIITNKKCSGYLYHHNLENCQVLNYDKDVKSIKNIFKETDFVLKITVTPPAFINFLTHRYLFKDSHLIIHNMNYWLNPTKIDTGNDFINIKKTLNRSKSYLINFVLRKVYTNVFKSFIAPSKELFENYKSFKNLSAFLDLRYPIESIKNSGTSEMVKIVIPGAINNQREYEGILEEIKKKAERTKTFIEITMLGKNTSNTSFDEYSNEFLSIKTYNTYVEEKEYSSVMQHATFVLLPLTEFINFKGFKEVRGFSKISGGVNDCFYYNIPFYLPDFYKFEDNYKIEDKSNIGELDGYKYYYPDIKKDDVIKRNLEAVDLLCKITKT